MTTDPSKIPLHEEPKEKIPICTKPITKEEYLSAMELFRSDQHFMNLPMSPWVYEEFPEFAESKEQIAAINQEWTEATLKAREVGNLDDEKKALEKRISKLKKMAKSNKAIRTAKKRILEIETRKALLEDKETQNIRINE